MPSQSIVTIVIDGSSSRRQLSRDLSFLKDLTDKRQKEKGNKDRVQQSSSRVPTSARKPQPVTCDCGKPFKHPDDMAQHKLTALQHKNKPAASQRSWKNKNCTVVGHSSRDHGEEAKVDDGDYTTSSIPPPTTSNGTAWTTRTGDATSGTTPQPVATLKPKPAFDPQASIFIPPRVPLFRPPPSQASGYSTPLIDLDEDCAQHMPSYWQLEQSHYSSPAMSPAASFVDPATGYPYDLGRRVGLDGRVQSPSWQ